MTDDEKLTIAIAALLALKDILADTDNFVYHTRYIVLDALRQIQRYHYLVEPSPVVAELIGARGL